MGWGKEESLQHREHYYLQYWTKQVGTYKGVLAVVQRDPGTGYNPADEKILVDRPELCAP